MARITRHSFRCPHCQREIAASWGDANYMVLPDAFSCPRCRQVVTPARAIFLVLTMGAFDPNLRDRKTPHTLLLGLDVR